MISTCAHAEAMNPSRCLSMLVSCCHEVTSRARCRWFHFPPNFLTKFMEKRGSQNAAFSKIQRVRSRMRSPASEARQGTREGSEHRLGARPKQRKTPASMPASSESGTGALSVARAPKKSARPTLGTSVRHAVDRILLAFSSSIQIQTHTETHKVAAASRLATMASFTPNPNFDKENSNPKDWAYHLGEWQALTSQLGMQCDANTDLPV